MYGHPEQNVDAWPPIVKEYCKQSIRDFVSEFQKNSEHDKVSIEQLTWSISRPGYLRPINFTLESTVGCCVFGNFDEMIAKLESARSCNDEDEDHGEIKNKGSKTLCNKPRSV